MKLKTLYVRFYKSFNYDYLRKSHPNAEPDPWDTVPDDGSFFPYVRVPLEDDITTVVGANESGKSQLLGAIKCLLTGEGIQPRDFCRYSRFFTVGPRMNLPEFGGEFDRLSDGDVEAVRELAGLDSSIDITSFRLFRTNQGVILYAQGGAESGAPADADAMENLALPTFFEINARTPLPDSVPLSYLTASDGEKRARSRKGVLGFFEQLLDKHDDWFGDAKKLDQAKPALLEGHAKFDASEADAESLMKRLQLAEKLLMQVAGIGVEAFEELQKAVKEHDGYANGIVAKMNEELAVALNFPKWWSQDSEFSLSLTLRDFDLVFTVRDRTGSEYAFSERSGGMSYFLSYFVEYLSHRASGSSEILLMDEPDAYLSMLGQQDLLRIFDSFAHPDDDSVGPVQVVYVTHSPFLIDKNHSERLRVLEKGDGEEGTRLVANAGRNHYEPLRSAFGAFVAETTFISNCNLMLEGQADQVLLAGISSYDRRMGTTKETLDLNSLSLVPAGSAEHIPYMVYLARGRDVDTPAIVVLLDGDDEADKIAGELRKGYRGRRYVDDEFVISTKDIDVSSVSVATDSVREIEDLIPAGLAVQAIHRFAQDVLPSDEAKAVKKRITTIEVAAGEKLYKAADRLCQELTPPLRLDKVGFARAVLAALEHDAKPEVRAAALENFEVLFALIVAAQRAAVRKNGRERVRSTVKRFRDSFLRDHPTTALRRDVGALLDDIEGQLSEVTDETEEVRAAVRKIRADFKLSDEPASPVSDFDGLKDRLGQLTYEGVRAVLEA